MYSTNQGLANGVPGDTFMPIKSGPTVPLSKVWSKDSFNLSLSLLLFSFLWTFFLLAVPILYSILGAYYFKVIHRVPYLLSQNFGSWLKACTL
jgi:hypothetical protein